MLDPDRRQNSLRQRIRLRVCRQNNNNNNRCLSNILSPTSFRPSPFSTHTHTTHTHTHNGYRFIRCATAFKNTTSLHPPPPLPTPLASHPIPHPHTFRAADHAPIEFVEKAEEEEEAPGTADPSRFKDCWAELMKNVREEEDDDTEVKLKDKA